jgi:FAD/FMN-containing dehydrogenase
MKDFEMLPEYTIGEYTGMAAQFGAGLEAWEVYNHMAAEDVTIVAAGGSTVGGSGGWMTGGGHSLITSRYGLGSDQVLSLGVVTADGEYQVADPYTNEDLFWALRGGGGGE